MPVYKYSFCTCVVICGHSVYDHDNFGFSLFMGINWLPQLHLYWNTKFSVPSVTSSQTSRTPQNMACQQEGMLRQDSQAKSVYVCGKTLVWSRSCLRPITQLTHKSRKKGDSTLIEVNCPLSIMDYNKYMGGVDRGDQYRKYYHVHVKSRKSYKYISYQERMSCPKGGSCASAHMLLILHYAIF